MRDAWLALTLSAVGIVMGAGSLTGAYGAAVEMTAWLVVGIGWAAAAVRWAGRPFWAVAAAGLASGIATGAIQAAFAATLVANNPNYGDATTQVDAALRWTLFASALALGTAWGILFGAVAAGVRRWRATRRAAITA